MTVKFQGNKTEMTKNKEIFNDMKGSDTRKHNRLNKEKMKNRNEKIMLQRRIKLLEYLKLQQSRENSRPYRSGGGL